MANPPQEYRILLRIQAWLVAPKYAKAER